MAMALFCLFCCVLNSKLLTLKSPLKQVAVLNFPMPFITLTDSHISVCFTSGFAQGVRRVFAGFGLIFGPLWAGSMIDRPYPMFAVMLGLNAISVVYVLFDYCHCVMYFLEILGAIHKRSYNNLCRKIEI